MACTSARWRRCCCRRPRSASSSRCATPRRSTPNTATRRSRRISCCMTQSATTPTSCRPGCSPTWTARSVASLTREQRANLESHLKALFVGRVLTVAVRKGRPAHHADARAPGRRAAGAALGMRGCAASCCRPASPMPSPSPRRAGPNRRWSSAVRAASRLTDGIPGCSPTAATGTSSTSASPRPRCRSSRKTAGCCGSAPPCLADITSRELLLREDAPALPHRLHQGVGRLPRRHPPGRQPLAAAEHPDRRACSRPRSRRCRGSSTARARETDLLRNHDEAARSLLDQAQNRRAEHARAHRTAHRRRPDGGQRRNTRVDAPGVAGGQPLRAAAPHGDRAQAGGQAPIDATAALHQRALQLPHRHRHRAAQRQHSADQRFGPARCRRKPGACRCRSRAC